MIEVSENLGPQPSDVEVSIEICLDYDQRSKGRLKAVANSGEDVGLFLERGKVLQDGDVLKGKLGNLVLVTAKQESLVSAKTDDWPCFARACYHLGNRHVPIEVGDRELFMRPDHILQAMVESLGLSTSEVLKAFNPEQGAYAGGHSHSHSHSQEESHGHSDSHSH
jgi:urease accessory protein